MKVLLLKDFKYCIDCPLLFEDEHNDKFYYCPFNDWEDEDLSKVAIPFWCKIKDLPRIDEILGETE